MKKISKILAVCMIIGIVIANASLALATTTAGLSIPNRPENSYVLDMAEMLLPETEININQRNSQLVELEAEIFVATVNTTGEESIEDFTKKIFTKWEIGGELEKGILFLVNKDIEGDVGASYYAVVGMGLNTEFGSDVLKNLIKMNVEPSFAQGDFDVAIDNFVKLSVETITGEESVISPEYTPQVPTEAKEDGGILGAIWNFIVILFFIILILVALAVIALILLNMRAQNIRKKRREMRKAKKPVEAQVNPVQSNAIDEMGINKEDFEVEFDDQLEFDIEDDIQE